MQTLILNLVRGFEEFVGFESVCKTLIDEFHLSSALEECGLDGVWMMNQFRAVYNNTHMPPNKGYTPMQMGIGPKWRSNAGKISS